MAGYILFPEIDPYPTTYVAHTYAEKGTHLHHIPLSYMAHKVHVKFHDKDTEVHQPKSDVRETPANFYVEVELPGVKDKGELHLRWTSLRTLLLTSKLSRPEIPAEETTAATTTESEQPAAPAAEAATETTQKPEEPAPTVVKVEPPHLTVHERAVGDIERAFHFPIDVDRDATHAKLDAGLLRIIVPKIVEHGKVEEIPHLPVQVAHVESAAV